jgi:very-short-patch-repair endonuclease
MLYQHENRKLYLRVRALARKMRKSATEAEDFFWEKVRDRRLFGLKWNRQYIIQCQITPEYTKYYIADFHCHVYKLIVELDGHHHLLMQEEDLFRTERISQYGFKVLRFTNEQVLKNWDGVEQVLREHVSV